MIIYTTPEYSALTDEQLVPLAKNGDETASDELYHRYKNIVRGKARPYFLVGADRDDLIQEGMIGFFKAMRDYDGGKNDSFRPFAEICITRQILTAIKQATRIKHRPLNRYESLFKPAFDEESDKTLADVIGTAADPEELYLKQEFNAALKEAVDRGLTEYERGVLDRFLDGKSYSEIAEELGHGVKSVDNALQRIRRKLEKLLNF